MVIKKRVILVIVFLLNVFHNPLLSEAQVTSFYVSSAGNDANAGTLDAPWRTVAKAANTLGPGQTALIRGGTYSERYITFANSGTSGNPITIKAYPGETPIIDAGFTAGGSGRQPVFMIDGRHYITIDGLTLTRGSLANIYIAYNLPTTNITIQNNIMTNVVTEDNAAHVYIATSGADKILVQNNVMHGRILGSYPNVGDGVKIFRALDLTIQNNEIYDVVDGIYYKHSNTGTMVTTIQNNLIHNVSARGIRLAMHDVTVTNNIIYSAGAGVGAIEVYEGSAGCDALHSERNKITHNTIDSSNGIGLKRDTSCPGAVDTVVRDNVITGLLDSGDQRGVGIWRYYAGSDASNSTVEYNVVYSPATSVTIPVVSTMYTVTSMPASVISRGHMFGTAPTFVNAGARDYALTSTSVGYRAASDGTDMGANTSTVGVNGSSINTPSTTADTTPPAAPTGLRLQ